MHPSVDAEPGSREGEGARPLALVADDEDAVRALVALRMEALGYEVVTARDGLDALERTAERCPDLVIVDNWMPRMDGLGVIRRLRAEERTRETPIILLTALVEEADIERGFEAGASMFCRKPFSPRELSGLVERVRAEQALRERERGERERAAEEAALRRVATAVAASLVPRVVFGLVAEEAARLLGAEVGRVCRFEGENAVVAGLWGRALPIRVRRLPLRGARVVARVASSGRPARVDDYDELRASEPESAALIPVDYRSGLAAPVRVGGALWGAIMVVSTSRVAAFRAADERRLSGFADLASMAIANADHQERLAQLAATDHLTGLPNRRAFDARLAHALLWAQKRDRPLSLVLFDLDHFKRVNDTFGHATGDAVLVETARRLEATVREGELVARIGGEEFGWILPDAGERDALRAAERARRAIAAHPFPTVGRLSLSAGASAREGDEDIADLLRRADRALYGAKRAGRDASRGYSAVAGCAC